jgi:hypothetical protein
MLIKFFHTLAWTLMLLNTQLIQGILTHATGTKDTCIDKLQRFILNPSPLKGYLGLVGLSIELFILWFC